LTPNPSYTQKWIAK